ncbi:MAG: PTS sugar transporter subunit IIA [Bifidobacterium sp.]
MYWDIELPSYRRDTFLNESISLLAKIGDITNQTQIVQALNARERQGNTLLSQTLALPHAQSGGILTTVIAYVKTKKPISDWQAGCTVDRFIFILLPEHLSNHESRELKAFFRLLADDRVMELLSTGSELAVKTMIDNQQFTSHEGAVNGGNINPGSIGSQHHTYKSGGRE